MFRGGCRMKEIISKTFTRAVKATVTTAAVSILSIIVSSYACGGGMMPYIPTGTGAGSGSASASGQFFIIDKGVTTSMFDIRQLQPLFRSVVNAGNERSEKNLKTQNDTTHVNANVKKNDSKYDSLNITKAEPVLNLHKLH